MQLRSLTFVATWVVSSALFAGCGDDEEEPQDDDHHTHGPESASCIELTEACHEADTGTGRPAECHEIAHSDVEADCVAELASCTADCEAALNDGGM